MSPKLFISADMEGLACVSHWDETNKAHPGDYEPARQQMTAEVAAACEGAYGAGVGTVVVKDSHWTGRNLDAAKLAAPEGRTLRLVRGWSGHPYSMVQGLDEGFDALAFVGYHSGAGRGGNPLAHTMSFSRLARVELNDALASEFLVFSYAAALSKVRVTFLSGDAALCKEAEDLVEGIVTVPTFHGEGPSITSMTPSEAVSRIRDGVARAVSGKAGRVLLLPPEFNLRVTFTSGAEAYRKSFYPGARLVTDTQVEFGARQYFEILRFLGFMTMM
jgi:D-amino peptidase